MAFRRTKDTQALNLFEKVLAHPSYDYTGVKIVALAYAGRIHADLKNYGKCSSYYAKARHLAEMTDSQKLLAVVHY